MTAVKPAAMAAVMLKALVFALPLVEAEALAVPATTPMDPDKSDNTVAVSR
jgi:hypothetical protein